MNKENEIKSTQVYIAGSLFSEAEQLHRKKEESYLKALLEFRDMEDKVKIFNPITNPFNDKSTLPSAEDIFLGDTKAIRESDYILLNLDNQLDAGVFVELGQIVGLAPEPHLPQHQTQTEPRPHTEHQNQTSHRPQTQTEVRTDLAGFRSLRAPKAVIKAYEDGTIGDFNYTQMLSHKFLEERGRPKHKKIYPVISDMRTGTAGEYSRERIPWGINTYVIGALYTYDPNIKFYNSSAEAIRAMVQDISLSNE